MKRKTPQSDETTDRASADAARLANAALYPALMRLFSDNAEVSRQITEEHDKLQARAKAIADHHQLSGEDSENETSS